MFCFKFKGGQHVYCDSLATLVKHCFAVLRSQHIVHTPCKSLGVHHDKEVTLSHHSTCTSGVMCISCPYTTIYTLCNEATAVGRLCSHHTVSTRMLFYQLHNVDAASTASDTGFARLDLFRPWCPQRSVLAGEWGGETEVTWHTLCATLALAETNVALRTHTQWQKLVWLCAHTQ